MKKAVSIILCIALLICSVFAFSSCTKQQNLKYDIVLITDGGDITDGGYNQSAWEGIKSYSDENALSCRYYQPVLEDGEITVENIEKYIELSAKNGAEFIVLPGEQFAACAYDIAPIYPDINFILIDAIPHSQGSDVHSFISNVMSVSFDTAQSGFLAGYIAVINGDTKLAYFGQAGSNDSANYGAGFVQGAAYAADSLGIPVTLDWADYDSPLIDYDYSIDIKACYEKIEDQKEKTYSVEVVNGIGSGTYTEGTNVTITADSAPEGKEFDHWEVKSNTEGVKDKKVNISSKTKSSMNLIVEKCDCTITAVYKDVDYKQYAVNIGVEGKNDVVTAYVAENTQYDIKAPAADYYMVFDHWESTDQDAVEDINAAQTKVNVADKDITLTAVYKISETPVFNVTVETGEGSDGDSSGSGAYSAGDIVDIAAALPADGYMFSHWENADNYSEGTGIAMENEYYWNTTFEMVDRYAAVCETMFDKGDTLIFTGGNDRADAAFNAKGNYHYDLKVMTAGSENSSAYSAIVKNYAEAVKDCLESYTGGTVVASNCSTDGIYATFVSDDEDIKAQYDEIYKEIGDGKITILGAPSGAGYSFCKTFNDESFSKCLTLNGWFLEGIEIPTE